ncbi:hypothetical protein B0H94_11140 [Salsuginibacillus halophilus]|uniref:Prolipoprotein diacylglyceryl transferase n=1 Tax=Salsuginibacillus halophilus TaxID=517424 RepID=A0A2P8HAG9_9BACI|nr:hypothetical protein [Salsuginibacillus halophilus]PSL43217.1 hypothetical protein B0H94_11140 [Salsuginibacillus halophilus]
MTTWQVGPLLIPEAAVATVIALVAAYLYVRYFTLYQGSAGYRPRDRAVNVLILIGFVYAFGTVLLNLTLFLSDPMAVLSYPSGPGEFILALCAAGIYIAVQHWKKGIDVRELFAVLLYIVLAAQIVYAVWTRESGTSINGPLPFAEHPIAFYTTAVSVALLFWLHRLGEKIQRSAQLSVVGAAWAFSQWLIMRVDAVPQLLMVYVPAASFLILSIVMAVMSILLTIIHKRR